MKSKINNNAAPQAKRLCGVMKRAALALLLCVLTTMTTWAQTQTPLTNDMTVLTTGTYYPVGGGVTGNYTVIDHQLTVNGNVELQLVANLSLTIRGGIFMTTNSTLTINGDDETAQLYIYNCPNEYAGIEVDSTNTITINGGYLDIKGGAGAAAIGGHNDAQAGTITINGGVIKAQGGGEFYETQWQLEEKGYPGKAIGCGGGLHTEGISLNGITGGTTFPHGGTITINGGEIWADNIGDNTQGTLAGIITINGGIIHPYTQDRWTTICGLEVTLDYTDANNFCIDVSDFKTYTLKLQKNFKVYESNAVLEAQNITDLNFLRNDLDEKKIVPCTETFYSVNKGSTTNGSIAVRVGGVRVNKAIAGSTVQVVATPAANYQLENVTVSGATLNSDNTFTMPAHDVTVNATFTYFPTPWNGSGTANDPFIIYTASDLQDLATGVNNGIAYDGYYFKQDADIDCSGYGMTPIGLTNAHPFKGNYNGQNNKIINYNLGQAYLLSSLFGHTEDATLTNIVMQNCNIDASSYNNSHAAGICASCGSGTTISNCRVTGTIKGKHAAGGIVAAINHNDVSVSDCFADVTVTIVDANGYRGKIYAGTTTTVHPTTSGCYYHDNGDGVGGCGYDGGTAYSDTEIAPVYTVTASNGLTLAATNATITHNGTQYFANGTTVTLNVSDSNTFIVGTPTVSGTGATYTLAADRKSMTVTVGSADVTVTATLGTTQGSCGTNATWSLADNDNNGTFETLTISGTGAVQDYSQNNPAPWGNAITIANVGDGITGIGDYAFANCSSLQRVDINYNGAVSIGSHTFSGCNVLQYIVFPSPANALAHTTGNWAPYQAKIRAKLGNQIFTATNEGGTPAYQIATEQDLRNLSTAVNGGNNGSGKTFRQTADITLDGSFTPIGNNDTFEGTYDGGNKTISGLSVSETYYEFVGLFGRLFGGTVKNVILVSPNVTSSRNDGASVGAVVGSCESSNPVVDNCHVINPTVSATGSGTNYVGAIIGEIWSDNATVTNCYFYDSNTDHNYAAYGRNAYNAPVTNVGRVRKVTLGSGMANVSPEATNTNGFVCNNETYYREGLTLTLTDSFGTTSEGYTKHYYANGNELEGATYTVNSTDVTFTADCRSDGQQHEVTYVDAQGESHSTQAIPLDGSMTSLSGTYYVGANITFTSTITLTGNVTLILANGKTMNVGTSDNRIVGRGIQDNGTKEHTFTIYGQSLDETTAGHLSIYNQNSDGIYTKNYNQQSGNVTVNSTTNNYTINCDYFNLSGGKLIAINNSGGTGIYGSQNISILGGQLDTRVGNERRYALTTFHSITLGWTNATDYIYATKYAASGTVNIASGQAMDNGTQVLSGTITDMSLIDGKTLTPKLAGSGTTDDPYLISNAGGWDLFCDLVQNSTYTFQGNVKLCANISVSRMAGSESKPFAGNFDGQNYTLTFNCNTSDDYVAPFRYVEGSHGTSDHHATISNLNVVSTINGSTHLAGLIANQIGLVDLTNCHVTATITSTTTTDSYCAGLVSHAAMRDPQVESGFDNAIDGTLTISGCTVSGSISTYGKYAGGFVGMAEGKTSIVNSASSVTINSFVGGNGTHGGFIGLQQDTYNYANASPNVKTTIEGCLFNGKLITSNGTTNCGGFIGWHDGGSLTIMHCLYAPADLADGENEISDGSYTFVGNGAVGSNCIYTRALGTAQGNAPHNIIAGEYVAVSNIALAPGYSFDHSYDVSGINSCTYGGMSYDGNFYIKGDTHVSFTLSNNYPKPAPAGSAYGYTANNGGTLSGSNPYFLTMPFADVTINVDTVNLVTLDWSGDGTESNPYMIYSKDQFDLLVYRMYHYAYNYGPDQDYQTHPNGYFFKLGADIVYAYTTDTENNFIPIGNGGQNSYPTFQGTFDGDGHTISGIRINYDDDYYYDNNYYFSYFGLFGDLSGTVKNVTLADAIITGNGNTGGIAGFINTYGTITNCHVAADVVIHAEDYTNLYGGIAGENLGTISHCTNAATLTIPDDVTQCKKIGGIAGFNSGTLSDNLVIGATIPAATDNSHGAICGSNDRGTLERNYYVGCIVAGVENATNVGCHTADITANEGAMPGNVRVVEGYGEEQDRSKWVFIASPVSGSISPTAVGGLIPVANGQPNTASTEYDLYRFNQSAEAEWENYHAHYTTDFMTLVNGQGYLYANKNDVTLTFTGTTYNTGVEPVEVPLVYVSGKEFAGWNLVGNPFPRAAYVNKSYYVINDSGTTVEPVSGSNTTNYISPCTGVMVHTDHTNDTIIFSTTPQTQSQSKGMLQVAVSQVVEPVETPARDGNGLKVGPSTGSGTLTLDKAIVSFNEGDELAKFVFNIDNAKIYIPQGAEEYAIACSDSQGEMPVNFKAYENGTYTIAVSPENVEMVYLHLIDNMTGADVDLLAAKVPELVEGPTSNNGVSTGSTTSYTFNAKTTDYESRFKLVFVCGDANDDNDGDNETFAFYFNGNWIIANDGDATLQVIDLNGRILSSERINGSVSKSIHAVPGVYMIRLINGEKVKVQKIVVR